MGFFKKWTSFWKLLANFYFRLLIGGIGLVIILGTGFTGVGLIIGAIMILYAFGGDKAVKVVRNAI